MFNCKVNLLDTLASKSYSWKRLEGQPYDFPIVIFFKISFYDFSGIYIKRKLTNGIFLLRSIRYRNHSHRPVSMIVSHTDQNYHHYHNLLDIVDPALLVVGGLPTKGQACSPSVPRTLRWKPSRGARHVAANKKGVSILCFAILLSIFGITNP